MNQTLNFIKEDAVCAEIGVWKGDFSSEILKKSVKKLHLIDPWKSITNVPARWHAAPQDEIDAVYDSVVAKFAGDERVNIIRDFSAETANSFEDGSIDWIYVDGDHSYEFVKQDLNLWWPKISAGGAICGDDYQEGKYQVETLDFGVVKAVDEFIDNNVDSVSNFKVFKDQFIIVK